MRFPDPVTTEVRIASAGMPGPLLVRGGECRILEIAGIPPGLFPDVSYDCRQWDDTAAAVFHYTPPVDGAVVPKQTRCDFSI